jgi:cytochrome c peroxidase
MNANTKLALAAIAVATVFSACRREQAENPAKTSAEVPLLPEKTLDYPESQNDHLATLGRVLFYDKQLSLHQNISCGTCHQQQHAFTDNRKFSPGTDGIMGHRNTPVVFPKRGKMFWDGRAKNLNDMVLRPIQEPVEMNQNMRIIISKIRKLDYYKHLFNLAFPDLNEPDSAEISRAIAEFVKNFSFVNTRFIQNSKGNASFTSDEQEGRNVFFNKGKCGNCHQVNGLTGSGQYYGPTDEWHNIGLDEVTVDRGVGGVTGNSADDGAFMMPVLLNVEHTAPYMHDGRFSTLEEVIEHYNSKVKPHPNLSRNLRDHNGSPVKLNLSDYEKKCLVAFLKTLSDPSLFTDEKFSDPFIRRPDAL